MTVMRLKGLKRFKDRHGKWRTYHRATGRPIKSEFGTPAFLAELAALDALVTPEAPPKPGTLHALVVAYRAAPQFLTLAAATRRDYQKVFDYLQPIGDLALIDLTTPTVAEIRDKALLKHKFRFANHVRSTLSTVCSWAVERGLIERNPVVGVRQAKRPKDLPDANRPWTDAERHAVMSAAPAHMRPALALMMYAGLGPKDALTLPRTSYDGGSIDLRRSKTGVPVWWPLPKAARDIFAEAPQHDALTLCANSAGRPWTVDGFSASFRTLKKRLEDGGEVGARLTLYGLRHTVAVILRELGYADRAIADVLGQEEPRMALRYAKGADLRRNNAETAAKFEAELNRRGTASVKPSPIKRQTALKSKEVGKNV